MTPIDQQTTATRFRQFVLAPEVDRHIQRTHQMLVASSLAAIFMVVVAGAMLAVML
jgi:hypothetical protein